MYVVLEVVATVLVDGMFDFDAFKEAASELYLMVVMGSQSGFMDKN